ncbi:MAG: DUF3604 domain-containing protein [Pseudomonadales bacterium]
MKNANETVIACVLFATVLTACQNASKSTALPEVEEKSTTASDKESAANTINKQALFGDLHVHTSYSLDSYVGFNRNGPDEAYRFAKGEPMPVPGGTARIAAPLDFAAVTDHAEYLGEMQLTMDKSSPRYNYPLAVKIRNEDRNQDNAIAVFSEIVVSGGRGTGRRQRSELGLGPEGAAARLAAWKTIQEATERHNEPGTFTTLHGFEWTSAPGGANLHRNIIFRDAVVPVDPVNTVDIVSPEELWQTLDGYIANGSTLLAIPHNSNASANLMFSPQRFDGGAIDTQWAQTRARLEPLVEVMQVKGNSETHPAFSPNDEFASFETFPLTRRTSGQYGYVRQGLKEGLRQRDTLGTNPFKFGLIGSTDTHNGTPADVEEYDSVGSHGFADSSPKRRLQEEIPGWEKVINLNPGAIAGVWAEANTRAAIYDALQRKETFGTSGPRISLRFFAGWNFSDKDAEGQALASVGYEKGVSMGGDLSAENSAGKAPTFLFAAMKAPDSANLDRLQIVKGWTKDGEVFEHVYDVAWSGERTLDAKTGKLPAVGNTVDIATASYKNTIGNPQFTGFWQDSDFDATVAAFYYLRVLEIPTPRWSTYDAVAVGAELPEGVVAAVQERGWSSPIWYSP